GEGRRRAAGRDDGEPQVFADGSKDLGHPRLLARKRERRRLVVHPEARLRARRLGSPGPGQGQDEEERGAGEGAAPPQAGHLRRHFREILLLAQQPEFGTVHTAALVAPRKSLPWVKRGNTRLVCGTKGVDP